MLKIVKQPMLKRLQNRLSIKVEADLVYLAAAEANRQICFPINITNPTPWKISITAIDCHIGYGGVVYVRHPYSLDDLPISIPAETTKGQRFTLIYDPFLSPLGLPSKRHGWSISGSLQMSSFFGDFRVTIPLEQRLEVKTSDEEWQNARAYVRRNMNGEEL